MNTDEKKDDFAHKKMQYTYMQIIFFFIIKIDNLISNLVILSKG